MGEEYKKFNEAEMVLGTMAAIFVGVISFILDLSVVGAVISFIIQGAFFSVLLWWEMSKGGGGAAQLGKQILKFVIGEVPLIGPLIIFWLTVILHNNPKLTAIAKKATGKPGSVAGATNQVLKKAA